MWKSRKAKHKDSRKVELPHKEKNYLPTGWDYQAVFPNYEKHFIKLTAIKGRAQIKCRVKSLPKNIVEIELVFTDKYYLAIKYKEEDNRQLIHSSNVCGLDLGEIHAITAIDNNGNAIIITNRKVRSLVRLKDKREGEITSLRSNCIKGSEQYDKYTNAIYKIKAEFDRKIKDLIHKQTKLFLDYCLNNNIETVFYGDLDTTTRNSKGKLNKKTNHKLNMWRFGQIILQLENKLSRHGIELVKIDESYSTQTCPKCNTRKKQTNRNYRCKECGYKQHRDIVGAINILNNNSDYHIENYISKVYLQIQ
jgi:putative transposase